MRPKKDNDCITSTPAADEQVIFPMPNDRPSTSACHLLSLKLYHYTVLRPRVLYLELLRRLLDNAIDSETGVHAATGHALPCFLSVLFAKFSADKHGETALELHSNHE